MPFDHYVPATYLARFSVDSTEPRRKRRVWAIDKSDGRVFRSPVENICGQNNLYSVDRSNPRIIDEMWGYEGQLNDALDELVAGTISARMWLGVLVNFVAALLARGKEFHDRFQRRFVHGFGPGILPLLGPDNTNFARLMEIQRLRASVLGAYWTVLLVPDVRIITNDLTFNAHEHSPSGKLGIAIPIDGSHVITLIPTTEKHVVAVSKDGAWWPQISRGTLSKSFASNFNAVMAASAQRFVIGETEIQMRSLLPLKNDAPPVPEPGSLGFMTGKMARQFEYTFFHTLAELSKPAPEDGSYIFVNYRGNARRRQRGSGSNY